VTVPREAPVPDRDRRPADALQATDSFDEEAALHLRQDVAVETHHADEVDDALCAVIERVCRTTGWCAALRMLGTVQDVTLARRREDELREARAGTEAAGVDDDVTKPVDPDVLEAALERAVPRDVG
jgi:CheY-like chemotaxis protein